MASHNRARERLPRLPKFPIIIVGALALVGAAHAEEPIPEWQTNQARAAYNQLLVSGEAAKYQLCIIAGDSEEDCLEQKHDYLNTCRNLGYSAKICAVSLASALVGAVRMRHQQNDIKVR